MEGSKNPEMKLSKVAMRTMWVLLVFGPIVVAYATGRATSFGRGADPLFFEVMAAGLLPVLLVAVIVQYSLLLSQIDAKGISAADKEVLRYEHIGRTRLYCGVFALGEGAALFAVATGVQTTFLLLITLLEALALLVTLLFEVETLLEPDKLLPQHFRKEAQARLTERAEKHEELAKKLRATADEKRSAGQ